MFRATILILAAAAITAVLGEGSTGVKHKSSPGSDPD
jgi:hypothetical protein